MKTRRKRWPWRAAGPQPELSSLLSPYARCPWASRCVCVQHTHTHTYTRIYTYTYKYTHTQWIISADQSMRAWGMWVLCIFSLPPVSSLCPQSWASGGAPEDSQSRPSLKDLKLRDRDQREPQDMQKTQATVALGEAQLALKREENGAMQQGTGGWQRLGARG